MPNVPFQQTVFLQSGDPLAENRAADGYSGGQLGSRFVVKDPNDSNKAKGFQLVQLDSAVTVATSQGAVAWWRNASGYLVTTSVAAAGRGNVAGVFGCAVTVDYICCIQQSGPAPVQVSSGTPADTGNFAIPSATDAKADAVAAGTASTYPPMGDFVSVATAGVATVNLTLPGRP